MEQEFLYRAPWPSADRVSGNHAGMRTGSGLEFHSHAPLIDYPDVRHLDLHTSLRDPTEQYSVRRYRQNSSLNVLVLADLSASLASFDKYRVLIELTRSIAWSSYRNGDRFGFLGGATRLLPELHTPPARHYASLQNLWDELEQHTPNGNSIEALLDCAEQLPHQRSLIFLLSDFHLPIETLRQLLAQLEVHDVVPVVLWHPKEYADLPLWRFVRLRDPETGRARSLFMRPRLQQAIQQRFEQQRATIAAICRSFGRQPFFVQGEFEADRLTDYFLGGGE